MQTNPKQHNLIKNIQIGKLDKTLSAKDFKLILKIFYPKLALNIRIQYQDKSVACLQWFGVDSNYAITWDTEMSEHAPMDNNYTVPTI